MICLDGDRSGCELAEAIAPNTNHESSTSVNVTTVDIIVQQVFQSVGATASTFSMKLDIEGSELRAFLGSTRTLSMPNLRAIHFEFLPDLLRERHGTESAPADLLRILSGHGFSIYRADEVASLLESGGKPEAYPSGIWQTIVGREVVLQHLPRRLPSFSLVALRKP